MAGISYVYRAADKEPSHDYLFPAVNKLLEQTPPGAVVYDLGCGNGSFLSLFQGRGWRLYGSDFSPTGIEIAKETFPGIVFCLADAESPDGCLLEDVGAAEVVISTEVIEHLYDPRSFIRTCYKLLRPGGRLILTTPFNGYFKNLLLAITGKLDEHFTVLWDHGHIKFWSKRTIQVPLTEAGFVEIEISGAGRVPYLWKSMVVTAVKPMH
jgi:2-polyprenyl-3-methyl-5-hydroxy-6-metoxy-1,4-benzoquinol methylase